MIFKSGSQAVFVIAEKFHERGCHLLHPKAKERYRWSLSLGLRSLSCNGDFPHGDLCGCGNVFNADDISVIEGSGASFDSVV